MLSLAQGNPIFRVLNICLTEYNCTYNTLPVKYKYFLVYVASVLIICSNNLIFIFQYIHCPPPPSPPSLPPPLACQSCVIFTFLPFFRISNFSFHKAPKCIEREWKMYISPSCIKGEYFLYFLKIRIT
jgi:hypothetical protein